MAPREAETDDCPWADKLLDKVFPAGHIETSDITASDSDGDACSDSDDSVDLTDQWAELEALRMEWDTDAQTTCTDFQYKVAGGKWLMQHHGKAADCFKATARGTDAKEWCLRLGMPRSARYEITAYTEPLCAIFGRTWCAKMQFFFDVAQRTGNDVPGPADRAAWQYPSEYIQMLPSLTGNGPAQKRIKQMNRLFRTDAV